jgi:redox-sensing transcriptional repressor
MTVSNKAVSRLSLYRSALARFKNYGAEKIYSCDLAETLGFTAAQVRKDFSMFRFTGKKKVGYSVEQLIQSIDLLLQKNHLNLAVLCGTGNRGAAFFIDQLLSAQGLSIAAAFDDPQVSPPETDGGVPAVPFIPIEKLIRYIAENNIRFGILASRGRDVQRMFDLMVLAGIKGVLNLTGTEIKAPRQCLVNSISVVREFEKLVYYVNNSTGKKGTGN